MSYKVQVRLFFDIETVAIGGVEGIIPQQRAPANVRDPEKVAAAVAEKTAAVIERAPLDPDLGRVRLITMQLGLAGQPEVLLVPADGARAMTRAKGKMLRELVPGGNLHVLSEAEALGEFWAKMTLCSGYCVGYNITGFDIPFLLRRSMELRVRPGGVPNLARYRTEPVTDLMGIMFNWAWGGDGAVKRLKWLCARYGIEVLAPDVDGSMVSDLTDAELVEYGLSDIHATCGLYRLMNGVYFDHATPE